MVNTYVSAFDAKAREPRALLDKARKKNYPSILKKVCTRILRLLLLVVVFLGGGERQGKTGSYIHFFQEYFNLSISFKYQFSLMSSV